MEKIKFADSGRKNRIRNLEFESVTWANNGFLIGIDEVGRGPLAGPVVAAAVMLKPGSYARLIKDSKLLDSLQLENAAKWVRQHGWYGIGIVDPVIIDKINIYQATKRAMRRAVSQLMSVAPSKPQQILIDAVKLNFDDCIGHPVQVTSFIKGESRSISIAAASIIAKVSRDSLMKRMHAAVPGYSFDTNKAYATAQHRSYIAERGCTIVHRTSFIDHFDSIKDESEQQNILC